MSSEPSPASYSPIPPLNTRRPPDGHIMVNGQRMAVWLPPGVDLSMVLLNGK